MPPVNPHRILKCPKCGADRETRAQPNTLLRCAECGARFKAPPLGDSGNRESRQQRSNRPAAGEAAPLEGSGGGVKIRRSGPPHIPPADPPPPAETRPANATPSPAPSADPGTPAEGSPDLEPTPSPAPTGDPAPAAPALPEPQLPPTQDRRGSRRRGGWRRRRD